jgi:hypothetical protein
LKSILRAASNDEELARRIISPSLNRELAIHFGIPRSLSLEDLRKCEKMNLNKRLRITAKIGDVVLIKRLFELGASDYDGCRAAAVQR